jgi:hypothetical protein
MIPKKLQTVTEKELLLEVSQELGIDIKDVNRTFDIWLKFLDHIANDTDQATIGIPNIGHMYVSVHKMRRGLSSEKLKIFKERKTREIEKLREKCKYIVHEKSVPVILKYGIAKRKLNPPSSEKKFNDFYTARDVINFQNVLFFKEDKDYSEQKKHAKYFLDEENNIDNKS